MVKRQVVTVSKKNKKKVISFIIFNLMILSFCFPLLYLNYQDLKDVDNEKVEQNNLVNNLQWKTVESSIYSYERISKKQADEVADQIRWDIKDTYKTDHTRLQADLESIRKSETLLQILNDNIRNKYIGISGPMSDIVILSKRGLVLEQSNDYKTKDSYFTEWSKMISDYYNQEIGLEFYNKAVKRDYEIHSNEVLFLERMNLEPKGKKHIMVRDMQMESLKKVFIKEGLDGFKNYEFFAVSYINKGKDILGKNDTDLFGSYVINNKIIVAQSFNIYEILTKNTNIKEDFKEQKVTEIKNLDSMYTSQTRELVLILSLFILFFISVSFFQNQFIFNTNTSDDEDKE